MYSRFDIVNAHYHYCNQYHTGQSSPEYARLSRILEYYAPRGSDEYLDEMTPDARDVYNNLVADRTTARQRALAEFRTDTRWDRPEPIDGCPSGWDETDVYFRVEDSDEEYLVLTNDEANERFREWCIDYLNDCLEIPDHIRLYFDEDAWIRDAKLSDGRGPALASYDGAEEEGRDPVTGAWFNIYRVA